MDTPIAPETLRRMRFISAGMIAGVLMCLGVLLFVRSTMPRNTGLAIASYVALALGLLSPVLAIGVDRMLAARPADPSAGDPVFQRHIATYGILEGSALFCAIALMFTPDLLPLAAALVPVGTMVLRFPRSS